MRMYFVNFVRELHVERTRKQFAEADVANDFHHDIDEALSVRQRLIVLQIGNTFVCRTRTTGGGTYGYAPVASRGSDGMKAADIHDYINKLKDMREHESVWTDPLVVGEVVQLVDRTAVVREVTGLYKQWLSVHTTDIVELINACARCPDLAPTTASKMKQWASNWRDSYYHSSLLTKIEFHGREYKGSYYDLLYIVRHKVMLQKAGKLAAYIAASGDESCDEMDELRELIKECFTDKDYYIKTYRVIRGFLDTRFGFDALEIRFCSCGHYESEDDVGYASGSDEHYCSECYDSEVVTCVENGREYHRDQLYYWESDDEYHIEPEPDDDDYDDDDASDDPDSLMDYSTNALDHVTKDESFTPSAVSDLLMGVELEIGVGGAYKHDEVGKIRAALGEDYCVCKYDGSLPDDGLEIVTAPRKLSDHISKFKDWQVPGSYRAWDAKRCGMHVHIDSRGFTKLTLGKFFMFINAETNADFIRKLAGRHPMRDNQAAEYCAAEHQAILDNPSKALKGKSSERYRMINVQNLTSLECNRLGLSDNFERRGYNTIELRIFRASLRKERLLAQLEFTHAAVMYCRVASWRDLNGEAFVAWLKTTHNAYPHLNKWFGISPRRNAVDVAATCPDQTPEPETVTTTSRDEQRRSL